MHGTSAVTLIPQHTVHRFMAWFSSPDGFECMSIPRPPVRLPFRGNPRSTRQQGNRSRYRDRSTASLLGDLGPGELFELAGIGVELANPLAQLLDGHGVLVVHPAEGLLVQVDLLGV